MGAACERAQYDDGLDDLARRSTSLEIGEAQLPAQSDATPRHQQWPARSGAAPRHQEWQDLCGYRISTSAPSKHVNEIMPARGDADAARAAASATAAEAAERAAREAQGCSRRRQLERAEMAATNERGTRDRPLSSRPQPGATRPSEQRAQTTCSSVAAASDEAGSVARAVSGMLVGRALHAIAEGSHAHDPAADIEPADTSTAPQLGDVPGRSGCELLFVAPHQSSAERPRTSPSPSASASHPPQPTSSERARRVSGAPATDSSTFLV